MRAAFELLLRKKNSLKFFARVKIVNFATYSALMSANGETKLQSAKLSLSFPTNNATSIRNVFCTETAKQKRKKKLQADIKLRMTYFFVKVERQQQYFNHLQLRKVFIKIITFSNMFAAL